jgi:hypothetical protein
MLRLAFGQARTADAPAVSRVDTFIPDFSYHSSHETTLDIPKPLFARARKIAARAGTTLRALVQEGLQKIITEKTRRPAFRLRKASFAGRG